MSKEDMLRELVTFEEKTDYFGLTTSERREFQLWVEEVLEEAESEE